MFRYLILVIGIFFITSCSANFNPYAFYSKQLGVVCFTRDVVYFHAVSLNCIPASNLNISSLEANKWVQL